MTKDAILEELESQNIDYKNVAEQFTKKELVDALLIKTSWHHTSKYFNETDFYGIREIENLQELSKILNVELKVEYKETDGENRKQLLVNGKRIKETNNRYERTYFNTGKMKSEKEYKKGESPIYREYDRQTGNLIWEAQGGNEQEWSKGGILKFKRLGGKTTWYYDNGKKSMETARMTEVDGTRDQYITTTFWENGKIKGRKIETSYSYPIYKASYFENGILKREEFKENIGDYQNEVDIIRIGKENGEKEEEIRQSYSPRHFISKRNIYANGITAIKYTIITTEMSK